MNNCAESAKRALKAHFADFWGRISEVHNNCKASDREEVRAFVSELCDRVKELTEKAGKKYA